MSRSPYGITEGPDAAMWFAEFGANKNGRATDVPVHAITLQPTSRTPGILVSVGGSGYGSFEKVQVVFIDSVNGLTVLGAAFADPTGDFGATVHVPECVADQAEPASHIRRSRVTHQPEPECRASGGTKHDFGAPGGVGPDLRRLIRLRWRLPLLRKRR